MIEPAAEHSHTTCFFVGIPIQFASVVHGTAQATQDGGTLPALIPSVVADYLSMLFMTSFYLKNRVLHDRSAIRVFFQTSISPTHRGGQLGVVPLCLALCPHDGMPSIPNPTDTVFPSAGLQPPTAQYLFQLQPS